MAEPLQEKHKIWDSYWHDSRMQSTVAESSPEAESALELNWRDFCLDLPNSAAIVDLGCGNGAAILTVARVSEETGKGFKLFGLDSAAIDPVKYVPKEELLKKIEFTGVTPMEVLPYQTGQFDAVISQYGMEFADSRALAEAVRVLKRGGKFCAITFAANTQVVLQAASKMRQSQYLVQHTKLFAMAAAVSQALYNIEMNPNEESLGRDSKQYLEKFSKEVENTMAKFKNADSEVVEAVITSLQHVFVIRKNTDIATQINMIAMMKKRISSHILRLEATSRAALGDSGLLGFKRKLSDAGLLNTTSVPLDINPIGKIGYKITGTRG